MEQTILTEQSQSTEQQVKEIYLAHSLGKNSYGYDEIECPSCKRHFYWSHQFKEFECVCGQMIKVVK